VKEKKKLQRRKIILVGGAVYCLSAFLIIARSFGELQSLADFPQYKVSQLQYKKLPIKASVEFCTTLKSQRFEI